KRLDEGTLSIYGWIFDVPTGDVYTYEEEDNKFVLIDEEFTRTYAASSLSLFQLARVALISSDGRCCVNCGQSHGRSHRGHRLTGSHVWPHLSLLLSTATSVLFPSNHDLVYISDLYIFPPYPLLSSCFGVRAFPP